MNSNQHQAARLGGSSRRLAFLSRALSLLLVLFGFGGGAFMPARAAAPPAPLTISSNRYLFIVDTSLSMKPRASGALQRIETLLLSDLNGNLQRGDTLGLWTYNEKLFAGQFPMQVWSPEQKQNIAKRFIAFMKKHPIEKKPKVALALAQMSELVKNSDNLTVLLISAGDEKVRGTPFDDEINAVFKDQNRSMQKAGMPFVTVLRAQTGKIFAYSINFGPWPIEIPVFPNSVAVVQLSPAKLATTNLPPPAVSQTTNKPASVTSKEKVAPAAIVKNDKPVVTESIAPKPAVPSPVPVNGDKPVQSPVVKSETLSTTTAPPAFPKAASTAEIDTAKLEVATLKPPGSDPPQPVVVGPAVLAPPAGSKPVVAIAEPKIAAPVAQPATPPDRANANNQAAEAAESSTPPIQTAAALPPSSSLGGGALLTAAIVLLLAALGLVMLFVRRARNLSQPSLITRSLDRREK